MSSLLLIFMLLLPGEEDALRYHEYRTAVEPEYDDIFQAALLRFIRGDVEQSMPLFEKVRAAEAGADYYLGIASYRQGDHDKAAEYFRSASRRQPDIWQPYYFLGLISLERHDIEGARRMLEKIPDTVSRAKIAGCISDYEMLEQARHDYAAGQYDAALERYGRIRAFGAYRDMGQALVFLKIGREADGLGLLDSIFEHSDDPALRRRAAYEAAEQYARMQEITEAKRYLRECLHLGSDDNVRFLMGRVLSEEAKYDSAAIFLAGLPDSVDRFLFFQGRVDYYLGQWGSAEQRLMLHREVHPHSPYAHRALFILGSINQRRKEYGAAIQFWQELVDSFPASRFVIPALVGIGDSYFDLRKFKQALQAYGRVFDNDPPEQTRAEVELKMYETRYHLGQYPSLIDALRSYIRHDPKSALRYRVRLRIAQLHCEQGEYYRCIDELDRVIAESRGQPLEAEALMRKMPAVQALADTLELLVTLRSLLHSRGPVEYRFYAAGELGALWTEEAQYDSALYYYNLLLEAEAYRENAMLKIADIYGRLGRDQEALAMAERFVTLYPRSAYTVDAYLLMARALKNEGQYESARQILLELSDRIGERADVCMEIGHLYYESGDFMEARRNYLRAGALYEQDRDRAAQALILAGDASLALGDDEGGREHYLRASMIAESPLVKSGAIQKLNRLGAQ